MRFWKLALDDTEGLLALMDLDTNGAIASGDGLYGRFGINHRVMLRSLARSSAASEAADGDE